MPSRQITSRFDHRQRPHRHPSLQSLRFAMQTIPVQSTSTMRPKLRQNVRLNQPAWVIGRKTMGSTACFSLEAGHGRPASLTVRSHLSRRSSHTPFASVDPTSVNSAHHGVENQCQTTSVIHLIGHHVLNSVKKKLSHRRVTVRLHRQMAGSGEPLLGYVTLEAPVALTSPAGM